MVDISGWLDSETNSGKNSVRESDLDLSHDQSSMQATVLEGVVLVLEGVVSEGASATWNIIAEEMEPGDGTVRSTSLAKREC